MVTFIDTITLHKFILEFDRIMRYNYKYRDNSTLYSKKVLESSTFFCYYLFMDGGLKMRKIKEKLKKVKEVSTPKIKNVALYVSAFYFFFLANVVPVLAEEAGIETGIKALCTKIRNLILAIATPIAGVMFLAALLTCLISKDERKVAAGKDWAIRVLVVYVLIGISSIIIGEAGKLIDSAGGSIPGGFFYLPW